METISNTRFSTFANLTSNEVRQAEADYSQFFATYPDQKNPTDINTPQKWAFAQSIGMSRFSSMQACRKQSLAFTKAVA